MLSVRPIRENDITLLLRYWFGGTPEYLAGMGVDVNRLPAPEDFAAQLHTQIRTAPEHKKAYCLIWESDGEAIGHCNTNPTVFGDHAYMHLHLWQRGTRRKGMGTALVNKSLPHFFETLQLKTLYCEPYALNPAPNKTLEKVGFRLLKEYITTPGMITFEQPVKRWELTREQFDQLPQPE